MAGLGQTRHEEAARAGVGEGLAALDYLVDQRIVMGLGLEKQVGPRIDEELLADRRADGPDPLNLQLERMQSLAADHLVLEVTADRAGDGEPRDIGSPFGGIGRIGAFEIDGERQLDRIGDALRIGEREVERDLLAVAEPGGIADRVAAGRQRFRARGGHGARAPDVPDVVKNDGVARHVQRGEGIEFAGHGRGA